jgi:hypothetical protein
MQKFSKRRIQEGKKKAMKGAGSQEGGGGWGKAARN